MNQPFQRLTSCIMLLLLLGSYQISYSQSPCEVRDRAALTAFYNALDGPNWINNTNWNTAAPLNTWYGITTDANGCVIGIDFVTTNIPGGNNLNGTLPDELGDLIDLQILNLINHNISGPVPSTIGNLMNLEYLNLVNNPLFSAIPREIGMLTSLRILMLRNNGLNGQLPIEFGNLGNLEMLLMDNNNLTGAIPNSLGNLSNLRQLWLENNQLNGNIPNSFANLTNIEGLILGNNQLDGFIPDIWGGLGDLISLGLNNNLFGGQIPNSISQLGNLFSLNLSSNQLNGNIPFGFSNLLSLSALYLEDNELEGAIPDLSSLPLNDFRFQNNRFQFGDFENEFNFYSNPANVTIFIDNPQAKLDIEEIRNVVEGNNTTLVTVANGNFNQYQWFKDGVPLVDGGNITGSNTDTLNISNLTVADNGVYHCEVRSTLVTDLILERHNITINVLPNNCAQRDRDALIALFNATDGPNWINNTNWNTAAPLNTWYGVTTDVNGCVARIDMNPTNTATGGNNLSGVLPDEIGNLLNLQFLDFSDQDLSGPIPNTIGNLQNLLWLELDDNELSGTLPSSLWSISGLDLLAIRGNNLSGSIPEDIGNLTQLRFFIGDQNNFTGNIPNSIGNLVNLEALWLYENQLSGPIPGSMANLSSLRQLLLNDNLLDGTIPDFWASLPNMEGIWLGGNQLVGPIPNSISSLQQLEQLQLQENQLTGEIPSNLGNLSSLRQLHLGDNEFSGSIPAELGNIQTLEQLTIYRTQVSGEIPSTLGNSHNLELLWLPFNNLSGEIPESLTNLSNLRQLILSNNQLTGGIPSDLNQLNNLSYLSLSNNLLEGTVPDFTNLNLEYLFIGDNAFQFGDFEDQFNYYTNNLIDFIDNPQAKVDEVENLNHNFGDTVVLSTTASGTQNHYQWYKDGVLMVNALDSPVLILTDIQLEDAGVYYVEITSDIVTDLVLTRHDIILTVGCLTTPFVDELDDFTVCERFVLPNLSPNNAYFTQPNGAGIRLNSGDVITQSQTIYILAGSPGCGAESEFNITIENQTLVKPIEDVEVCESYILPTISIGNYYTESNGQGNILFAGDPLTTSQTIYVYVESGSCFDEESFLITVEPSLCPVSMDEDILFPKFFTPNNDGYNDVWKKESRKITLRGNVHIYDRYGKLVAEMDADNGYWDGKYKGVDMPSTDYWYKYVENGTGEMLTGHFTLKR